MTRLYPWLCVGESAAARFGVAVDHIIDVYVCGLPLVLELMVVEFPASSIH